MSKYADYRTGQQVVNFYNAADATGQSILGVWRNAYSLRPVAISQAP